jgi:hypothetical protein
MSEKEEFEDFASKALRLNRRGSFEQLLANHLILAVNAEVLHKLRLTLEAAYMVDHTKVKIDKEQLDTLYSLTLSFLGTNEKTDFISIAWAFTETEQNFSKYVKPWLQPVPLSFSHDTEFMRQQKQKQLDESSTEWQRFFLITKELNLHQSSFNILKGLFLKWSLPQVMTIFEKLSKQVDPSIYQDVLAGIKGEKTKRENHMG